MDIGAEKQSKTNEAVLYHNGSTGCIWRNMEGDFFFGAAVIQKHFCQFNSSHWQKECFVTKPFKFPALLNCRMSRDSLTPYATVWMWTRVSQPIKDSNVSTFLNIPTKAAMSNKQLNASVFDLFMRQSLGFIFYSNIHPLQMSLSYYLHEQMLVHDGKHLLFMAQLIWQASPVDFQQDFLFICLMISSAFWARVQRRGEIKTKVAERELRKKQIVVLEEPGCSRWRRLWIILCCSTL